MRKIKPHKGGRTFRPSIRLTREEWELIKQNAYDLNISVSDWMVYKAKKSKKKVSKEANVGNKTK